MAKAEYTCTSSGSDDQMEQLMEQTSSGLEVGTEVEP